MRWQKLLHLNQVLCPCGISDTSSVAIRNPEWHVGKASHHGSKQQQSSCTAISLTILKVWKRLQWFIVFHMSIWGAKPPVAMGLQHGCREMFTALKLCHHVKSLGTTGLHQCYSFPVWFTCSEPRPPPVLKCLQWATKVVFAIKNKH